MKELYHVIGDPIKHSLSPKIQMELATKYNQKILFTAIKIAPQDLEQKILEFKRNPQIKGLSVTAPHKEQIFKFCDDASNAAKKIKVASNVIFTSNRKMIALNYDGLGLLNDIKHNYNIEFVSKRILVMGAGGGAKAIISALIPQNPFSITVCNRNKAKINTIKALFDYSFFPIYTEEFQNIKGEYDIIINATSSSREGDILPLSKDNFSKKSFGYDLTYADEGTVFTKWCDDQNIKSADGKGMLQELSKLVFKFWRKIS